VIVSGGDRCGSQPRGGSGGIDMSAALSGRSSLIKSNDEKRVLPVRTAGHQWHECLKKGVPLGCRAVMHVVDHVRNYERKVHGRVKTRQPLDVSALALVESNAFEANRRIVFPDVGPGNARSIDNSIRVRLKIGAIARIVLSIDAPRLSGGG